MMAIQPNDAMKEGMKQRLGRIAKKKMTTAMVGGLAQFETSFGHLWGHGKAFEDLTPEEAVWRTKWEEVRNNIFNHGNQQIRSFLSELSLHTVVFNGYQATLIPADRYFHGDENFNR